MQFTSTIDNITRTTIADLLKVFLTLSNATHNARAVWARALRTQGA
ncbi:MAG: hypothetical protein LAO51_00245 [Acidobacteriia bacterium]|nr:hypothetical protein [Terriglobia bacterium]